MKIVEECEEGLLLNVPPYRVDVQREADVIEDILRIYGFNNVYNWNMSVGLSTKLYGFYIPSRKLFGDKIQAVRHVFTPTVSFSYAPDFGASRYGYWDTYQKTDADGNVSLVSYSKYANALYGAPDKGKSGNISFYPGNNIEMKVKSDEDSTGYKKLSIIDAFDINMSYNTAAKVRPWSDMNINLRLKWWKNYTFNMNAVFATYAYELDDQNNVYGGYPYGVGARAGSDDSRVCRKTSRSH